MLPTHKKQTSQAFHQPCFTVRPNRHFLDFKNPSLITASAATTLKPHFRHKSLHLCVPKNALKPCLRKFVFVFPNRASRHAYRNGLLGP